MEILEPISRQLGVNERSSPQFLYSSVRGFLKRTLATALLTFIFIGPGYAEEISLYDSTGKAVAYIADDLTVYLWAGEPVAYLELAQDAFFQVYRFDGEHLGWLQNGIIFNHDGYAVGAFKSAFSGSLPYEGYKGYKGYKPYKGYKKSAPSMPTFEKRWSQIPLGVWLSAQAGPSPTESNAERFPVVFVGELGYFMVRGPRGVALLQWFGGRGPFPMKGDVLIGQIDQLGMVDLYNQTRGEVMSVFMHRPWDDGRASDRSISRVGTAKASLLGSQSTPSSHRVAGG